MQAKPAGLSRLQPTFAGMAAKVGTSSTRNETEKELRCALNVNVTITSHRLQNLQDMRGIVKLHGNKKSWERWTLQDAGNGTLRIVSQSGRNLGDDAAQLVLRDSGHEFAKWRISYAGDGKFFVTSHRNQHLSDWDGVLTMHSNLGEWEKWYINTLDGALACTSPQVEADELLSLRKRMLNAEEMLFRTQEVISAGCTTTKTSTTPGSGLPDLGRCAVFGDPHFITFDGGHTTFVGDRILWVVRSRDVWMQAISRKATGNFMGFAVGGPFMDGHVLIVYNASDGGPLRAEWDGQRILEALNDEFHDEDIGVGLWRSESWDMAMHDSKILEIRTETRFDIGPFPERFTGSPEGGLFLLKLPRHVEVTMTGVDFMSAVITMPAQEGGQSGYCGDFNGDAEDDYDKIAPSWNRPVGQNLGPVAQSMNLFKNMKPSLLGFSAAATSEAAKESLPLECPESRKFAAEQNCLAVDDMRMRQDCVFDFCQTGAMSVVEGTLAAEVLEEKVNARGSIAFMGHGRCLDSQGHRYAVFATKDVRTEAECMKLLREVAFNKGVLGAELQRTSSCLVIVEGDVDLTTSMAGSWLGGGKLEPRGTAGEAVQSGTGIITGTTTDPAWSCWSAI